MSEEKKDFVVKDRRIFAGEDTESEAKGEDSKAKDEDSKASSSSEQDAQAPPETEESRAADDQERSQTDQPDEQPQLPEINFPTFVVSLNASALLHLGAIEDPTSGKKTKDLPMAKQTIDILSMLAEKTVGNLQEDEEQLLKNILYDLRMMYVKEKG